MWWQKRWKRGEGWHLVMPGSMHAPALRGARTKQEHTESESTDIHIYLSQTGCDVSSYFQASKACLPLHHHSPPGGQERWLCGDGCEIAGQHCSSCPPAALAGVPLERRDHFVVSLLLPVLLCMHAWVGSIALHCIARSV